MRKKTVGLTLGALLMTSAAAAAAGEKAADLLFEHKHLVLMSKGSEVAYRFQRTVSDPKVLGESFSDDIKIGVVQVKPDDTRELEIKIFTGERARDTTRVPDLTGNPLLVWYLDRATLSLSQLAGGERMFYKDKMRRALGDKALVEPVKVDYGGKSVDGFRVTITPFIEDPSAFKMRGFERARFAITVSDAVPGYFVDMVSIYENTQKEAPRLEERISVVDAAAATAGAPK